MEHTLNTIPDQLLEIKTYEEHGFRPLIDFDSWRVAILNYIDELDPSNIHTIEKHNETDEVFILLKGEFILYIGEHLQNTCGKIYGIKLEPLKVYNVKRGVWHTHTLSKDGSVLIVENSNTSKENSTSIILKKNQKERINQIASSLLS